MREELLDRVVAQVGAHVLGPRVEARGRRPEIAALVDEALAPGGREREAPDVELPAAEEQRVLDVLLDEEALARLDAGDLLNFFGLVLRRNFLNALISRLGNPRTAGNLHFRPRRLESRQHRQRALVAGRHVRVHLRERAHDRDSVASVQALWLQDPQVVRVACRRRRLEFSGDRALVCMRVLALPEVRAGHSALREGLACVERVFVRFRLLRRGSGPGVGGSGF